MTYAMTLDNSWELMTEDEMYDVNGGFLGWSGDKFIHNLGVIAGAIFNAVLWIGGTVLAASFARVISQAIGSGAALQVTAKAIASNIAKASVATGKWLYGIISASWGWTLGVAAITLLVGVTALGYITL